MEYNMICPKCGQNMLIVKTHLTESNDIKYGVMCLWCDWNSKIFETKQEVLDAYDKEELL